MIKILFILLQFQINNYLSEIFLRNTFEIHIASKKQTAFLIEHKSINYLVTARHIFLDKPVRTEFKLFNSQAQNNLENYSGTVFYNDNPSVDLVLIKPTGIPYRKAITLENTVNVLGDSGYFLGFPFDFKTITSGNFNLGYPIPLVKKATYSGVALDNNVSYVLLDGINNPGFSGGPIIFRSSDGKKQELIGVIGGYFTFQTNYTNDSGGSVTLPNNSGIIFGTRTKHILEILEKFN